MIYGRLGSLRSVLRVDRTRVYVWVRQRSHSLVWFEQDAMETQDCDLNGLHGVACFTVA